MPRYPLSFSLLGWAARRVNALAESGPGVQLLAMAVLWLALAGFGTSAGGAVVTTAPWLVLAGVLLAATTILMVRLAVRHLRAPIAMVEASASGGVVAETNRSVRRILRFAGRAPAAAWRRPYVVVRVEHDHLVVSQGSEEARFPWNQVVGVERADVRRGLGRTPALVLAVSRGARVRTVVLVILSEPGLLGLRRTPEQTLDHLAARVEGLAAMPPRWGSR